MIDGVEHPEVGRTVELDPAAVEAVETALAGGGPVQMVNLLRFRREAVYGDAKGAGGP